MKFTTKETVKMASKLLDVLVAVCKLAELLNGH